MQLPDTNPKSAYGVLKTPMHLVPTTFKRAVATVFQLGAIKYGPFNWRDHSVSAQVYFAAAQRHLDAWFDGEDTDAESGESHLAHAACCMAILIDAIHNGKLIDDRYKLLPTADCVAVSGGSVDCPVTDVPSGVVHIPVPSYEEAVRSHFEEDALRSHRAYFEERGW